MSISRRPWLRRLVGFAHRLAYATALGFLSWAFAVLPYGRHPGIQAFLARLLDFPIAVAGLVLPDWLSGIDLFFGGSFGHWLRYDETLWLHLRAAIPVYVFLFYLPNLLKGGIGLLRRWRRSGVERKRATSPEVAARIEAGEASGARTRA
jgi:hypothetical protein